MFKNFIKLLNRAKLHLLVVALVGFLLGFFITGFVANNHFSYYTIELEGKDPSYSITAHELHSYAYEKLVDILEYNTGVQEGGIEGNKIYFPSGTDAYALREKMEFIELENNKFIFKVPMGLFTTTLSSKTQKLNDGMTKFSKLCNSLFMDETFINSNVTVVGEAKHIGYHNPYLMGLYSMLIAILILTIVILVASRNEGELETVNIYDNDEIFKTPFHKRYWVLSKYSLYKVKNLATISILFALMLACKAIPLPSGFGALGISLTYLFFAIIAMLYGPIAGIMVGMLSDILGHFIFPPGMPFFPGYTLDSMLAGLTYGIFFYRSKISFTKCFLARLIVNLFINVFLGSIWWSVLNNFTFDAYITYMLVISLPKNLIYLLPQSILLFILFKALMNPLKHFNLIDYRICDNVTIF